MLRELGRRGLFLSEADSSRTLCRCLFQRKDDQSETRLTIFCLPFRASLLVLLPLIEHPRVPNKGSPSAGVLADESRAIQEPVRPAFGMDALVVVDVCWVGGKLSGFVARAQSERQNRRGHTFAALSAFVDELQLKSFPYPFTSLAGTPPFQE